MGGKLKKIVIEFVEQFHRNLPSKTLSCEKMESVFNDVK